MPKLPDLFIRRRTDGSAFDLHIGSARLAGVLQSLITAARPMGEKSFQHEGILYTVCIHDTPAQVREDQHVQIDQVLDPLAKGS